MRTASATLAILAFLMTALLTTPAARAQGESPAELRRENDELRNRVAQFEAQNLKLEQQVTALRSQLAQAQAQATRAQRDVPRLEAENKMLRDQLRALGVEPEAPASPAPRAPGSRTPDPTSAPTAVQLPDDPMACPPCLLQALRAAYDDRFASKSIDDGRADYIKEVRRWAGEMKRAHRGPITWTVEIAPSDVPGDDALPVKLRVVDPVTKDPVHTDTTAIDLGRRHTRRIISEPDQRYWTIEGVLFADPQVNADRDDEGPIPYPPFIGPYAEFEFGLSVRVISPAQ